MKGSPNKRARALVLLAVTVFLVLSWGCVNGGDREGGEETTRGRPSVLLFTKLG